jgi:hypothetical protein
VAGPAATSPGLNLASATKLVALGAAAFVALAVAVLAVAPQAKSAALGTWYWSEGRAEQTLEVSYHQPDIAALADARSDYADAVMIGDPSLIRDAERRIDAANRGFAVDFANCQGRGRAWRSMFQTFRCKLDMSSAENFKTVFVTVRIWSVNGSNATLLSGQEAMRHFTGCAADAAGNVYLVSMFAGLFPNPATGSVVKLAANSSGSVSTVASNLLFSNGITVGPDGQLYVSVGSVCPATPGGACGPATGGVVKITP